ncbi:hypothetical protein Tco_0883969, partial [Tanacetum coccineum]
PGTQDRGCGYFMWMDDLRLHISSSSGSSTPLSSYPGTSTRLSYGNFQIFTESRNCSSDPMSYELVSLGLRTLRPAPYLLGGKALQLLRKLGSRNRRCPQNLLPLSLRKNPKHGLRFVRTRTVPWMLIIEPLIIVKWKVYQKCMRTRSSLEYTIPRRRNRRRSQQQQEAIPLIPDPIPMADDRPMAEQLQAPTEGFESAIVVPPINAQNFELKSSLINLVQN